MGKVLIIYSTVDGHTHKICEHVTQHLQAAGIPASIVPLAEFAPPMLEQCEKVIVGASIRYGNYRPELEDFVRDYASRLNTRPSAFFTVNLVARKPGRDTPETNPYVRKLLKKTAWLPDEIGVFAGKVNYPIYKPMDRAIIRFIMWLTGGPTDPGTVEEFTDWAKVSAFSDRIARL
jgi:menaquinone-dependent protoporphyrinogen oxidase